MSYKIKKKEKVLIATHNQGKAREFEELFKPYKIETFLSSDFGIKEPKETGLTFEENSILKAKSGLSSGLTVISDDSGLCVSALDGEPGIYSARLAKKCGGWSRAMQKIYTRILNTNSNNFSAKYFCCLTIAWQDGKIKSYAGEIKGAIKWPPVGSNGFGYDPFFYPEGSSVSFGQMEKSKKMNIDHRSIAFKKIISNHYKN
tara:strand:+ start:2118 stop:2723 length:606 start_codon:yes stop_codon:yes gene_type:complete